MKLSFATLGCPAWNLEQIVANAARMGFDGVELRGVAGEHIGPEESPADRARIKGMFADAGVQIAAIMGYSRFTAVDAADRDENVHVALKFLEVARDIGCPTLRVFGGVFGEWSRDEAVDLVVAGLRQLTPKAEETGVQLALETHDDWCRGENLRAVLDGVGSDALGVCWDVSNAFFVEPMAQTFEAIRDDVCHVHFKDAVRLQDGTIRSALPGTGEVDMKGALDLLTGIGYDAWLSFEWEKKWEPELDEPEIAFPHYLKHSLLLLQN